MSCPQSHGAEMSGEHLGATNRIAVMKRTIYKIMLKLSAFTLEDELIIFDIHNCLK
jgi:hypothetical protein